ncbi:MAG: hypothetical protein MJ091_06690 [Clostridia bacterium]|nr:hypothetical protein [Clostridia bacterium]
MAQKNNEVINISPDLPKSFIAAGNKRERKVYLSPLATSTVLKRINNIKESSI